MTVKMLKPILGLSSSIDKILESCSLKPGVSDICKKYKDALKDTDEVMLYESFVTEIRPFNGLEVINAQIQKIERLAEAEKINISILQNLAAVNNDGNIGKIFESEVVDYLVNKNNPTMSALRGKLSMFEGDPHVNAILESVKMDEYGQRIADRTSKMELNESANPVETLYTKEQLDEIVKTKVDEAVAEAKKEPEQKVKHIAELGSFVKLNESLDRIYAKESRNEKVKQLCEYYRDRLNEGVSELALYEEAISNMSNFTYLNAVDTELSALNDRIKKYRQEIDLTKIVDTMKVTESYFIVPFIEEAVANYMKNKNATTRFMLNSACESFMFDKYVKDIVRVVNADDSISNLFHGSAVSESASTLNEHLTVKKIFSPVLYIKESECIFNVGGVYYDRKGQTISKLSKASVENLSESFKAACNVLNSGRVSYDEASDGLLIKSATNGYRAIINESGLSINGTPTDFSSINENTIAYERYSGNGQFFDDVKAICESYDIISDIPFVKRVSLNESDKSVDLFRLKNGICLALNEGATSTFYRNVNPIQCKNYINEHMNINASMMFESLMPNQKVIEGEIEDSKKAYEAYIEELRTKKKELQSLKESGETDDDEAIDTAIGMIDKELDDIMGDYQEYQKKADEFTGKSKDDDSDDKDGDKDTEKDKAAPDDVKSDVSDPLGDEAEKNGEATVNPDDANGTQDDSVNADGVQSDDDQLASMSPSNISYTEFDGVLNTPKSDGDFQVVKVSFDKNIKNGKTSGNGSVIVMTPTVNSNGDVKDEITTLTFSLDPSTKKPLVNNEHMPLAMYNAIVDAIASSPEIDTIDVSGTASPVVQSDASVDVPTIPTEPTELQPDEDPFGIDQSSVPAPDAPVSPADSSVQTPVDSFKDPVLPADNVNPSELGTHVTPEGGEPLVKPDDDKATDTASDTEDDYEFGTKDEGYVSVANTSGGVKVGIFEEDLGRLSLDDFEEEVKAKEFIYEKVKDKETGKNAIVITCENRADVIALRKFFEHLYGITSSTFFKAFPELRCYESFAYKKADKLYNKLYESADDEELLEFDLPYSPELADALKSEGYLTKEYVDELTPESDTITVEVGDDDLNDLCDYLWDYIKDIEPSEYRKDLIDAVSEISVTTIPVELPVDDGLISELDKKGLVYDFTDDNEDEVCVYISSEDDKADIFNVCDKLGIDLGEDGPLAELDKWTEDLEDVNEGLKITVEDTENHKKITFDTDDLDADKKDETDKSEEEKDGDSGFGNDTELFNSKEDAENGNNGDNNSGDQNNQNGGQNESSSDVKKKVKFRFKPRKVNESAVAALGVGDTVKYKGRTGRVTEKRPDGHFVVLVQGSTFVCNESELVPVTVRVDAVDFPHKFDKTTLKNLDAQ